MNGNPAEDCMKLGSFNDIDLIKVGSKIITITVRTGLECLYDKSMGSKSAFNWDPND